MCFFFLARVFVVSKECALRGVLFFFFFLVKTGTVRMGCVLYGDGDEDRGVL